MQNDFRSHLYLVDKSKGLIGWVYMKGHMIHQATTRLWWELTTAWCIHCRQTSNISLTKSKKRCFSSCLAVAFAQSRWWVENEDVIGGAPTVLNQMMTLCRTNAQPFPDQVVRRHTVSPNQNEPTNHILITIYRTSGRKLTVSSDKADSQCHKTIYVSSEWQTWLNVQIQIILCSVNVHKVHTVF